MHVSCFKKRYGVKNDKVKLEEVFMDKMLKAVGNPKIWRSKKNQEMWKTHCLPKYLVV